MSDSCFENFQDEIQTTSDSTSITGHLESIKDNGDNTLPKNDAGNPCSSCSNCKASFSNFSFEADHFDKLCGKCNSDLIKSFQNGIAFLRNNLKNNYLNCNTEVPDQISPEENTKVYCACYPSINCLFPTKDAKGSLHCCSLCKRKIFAPCMEEKFENNQPVICRYCEYECK